MYTCPQCNIHVATLYAGTCAECAMWHVLKRALAEAMHALPQATAASLLHVWLATTPATESVHDDIATLIESALHCSADTVGDRR